MTEKLPDPLVPPEVDLRDFDFMPLHGGRLFKSDTWIMCNHEERVAALRLWWAAWHQEPAGSLPDNDRLLADLAGYGVAVEAFSAIKANAMRGWALCSDGRLYHPVVCDIALESWKGKRKKESDNAAERERKRRKRGGRPADNADVSTRTEQEIPADNPSMSARTAPDFPADGGPTVLTGARVADGVPAENAPMSGGQHPTKAMSGGKTSGVRRTGAEIPAENALKEKEKKKGREEEALPPSPPSAARAEPGPAKVVVADFLRLRDQHWPNDSRLPAPTMSIEAEAVQFLAKGGTPELVAEIVDRGMAKAAAEGKGPPNSLRAYGHSIANGIAAYVKPVPDADTDPLAIPGFLNRTGKASPAGPTYMGRPTPLRDGHPIRVEHQHLTAWLRYDGLWSEPWTERKPASADEARTRIAALEPSIWPDAGTAETRPNPTTDLSGGPKPTKEA